MSVRVPFVTGFYPSSKADSWCGIRRPSPPIIQTISSPLGSSATLRRQPPIISDRAGPCERSLPFPGDERDHLGHNRMDTDRLASCAAHPSPNRAAYFFFLLAPVNENFFWLRVFDRYAIPSDS